MTTPYLSDIYPPEFNWVSYVSERLPRNYANLAPEKQSAIRKAATRDDPLLWALIYMRQSLLNADNQITVADMHIRLCQLMRPLRNGQQIKRAFIAPRRAGKSTFIFKILMLWAASHEHIKFPLYMTASASQARKWITNIKRVFDTNPLLQFDYPKMVTPLKRKSTNRAFNDDQYVYSAKSGFTMAAFGLDAEELGLNINDARPDVIVLDDVEPHGGSYSLHQMNQRLNGIITGAIPMGTENASVIFVGTVNMPGSIFDQLREHAITPDPKSWISDLDIKVTHFKPIVDDPKVQGGRRSFWEGSHKFEYLLSIEGTRYFQSVYANEPVPEQGAYWREGDIKYGTIPDDEPMVTVLSLDPAVTSKSRSDFSALSVIRYAPGIDMFEVAYGRAYRLNPGTEVPQKVAELIGIYPEIAAVLVETNQGGELWHQIIGDIPGVRLWTVHQNTSKNIRAAEVLHLYQTGRVKHAHPLSDLEKELYSFPSGLYDDLVDCVTSGVIELRQRYGTKKTGDQEYMYT